MFEVESTKYFQFWQYFLKSRKSLKHYGKQNILKLKFLKNLSTPYILLREPRL